MQQPNSVEEWLQERLQLDSESISKLVKKRPAVLTMSIEDKLEPTIKFFEDCVGSDAARNLIIKDPVMLSTSLENRLKPRLEDAQEAGVLIDTGILSRMGKYTEERWTKSLNFQKTGEKTKRPGALA
jgi:hypothetical protein